MDIVFEWVDKNDSWLPSNGWRVHLRYKQVFKDEEDVAFIWKDEGKGGACYLIFIAKVEVNLARAILDTFKAKENR